MTGSGSPVSGERPRTPGIWRNSDFQRFWMGQSISQIGSQISQFAVPLLALELGLGEGSVGLLRTAILLPSLILAVPVGDLADRHRRRPLMLLADGLRALLTAAVVCAAALHVLSLWELWVMLFLSGSCAVLFDVCYPSVVPSLVPQEQLASGNSALQASNSFATVAGPALAGALIGFLPVWAVLALDGISFVASVLTLAMLRSREPLPRSGGRENWLGSATVGLRQVVRSPLLRPGMLHTASRNVFAAIFSTYLLVFEIRGLHFPAAEAGVLELLGGCGFLLGAVFSRRLAERIGIGPLICAGSVLSAVGMAVTVSASGPLAWLMVIGGLVCYGAGVASSNLQNVTLRQAVTPAELFGRVTAALRLSNYGALPLGALAGSAFVPALGLRSALLIAAIGALLTSGFLLCSAVRRVRTLPPTEPVWGSRQQRLSAAPPAPPSTSLVLPEKEPSVNVTSADHPSNPAVVAPEQDLATAWDLRLRRDAGRAAELAYAINAHEDLRRLQHPQGPVAVRPLLLHARQAGELTRVANQAIGLVREECRRRAVDPFALAELLETRPSPLLTGRPSWIRWATALARPDLVFSGGVPKVLECNISSATGGPETCALLDRVFWPSPEARYFAHQVRLRSGDAIGLRRELLLKAARARGATHPYLAVAGWSGEYLSEALLDAARNGAPCVFVELEELTEDGGLRTGTGRRIDVLLLKFLTSDAYADGVPMRALEDAVRHDSALLVSTELASLYSNKTVLAWLTESAPSLPSAERAFIARHVPWTAQLRDIRVRYDGCQLALPTLLERRKDDFVLKPADGHSAHGVLVGRETDESAWRAAIEERLERGHVAQKFCVTDTFPMTVVPFGTNEASVVRMPCILGPLLVDGRFGGISARFSAGDGLIISAARGAIGTTFIWS